MGLEGRSVDGGSGISGGGRGNVFLDDCTVQFVVRTARRMPSSSTGALKAINCGRQQIMTSSTSNVSTISMHRKFYDEWCTGIAIIP